jgi:hypothetical protein
MKRTRLISVEIEHRELSISVTRRTDARRTEDEATASTVGTPVDRHCPVCGSVWSLLPNPSSSPADQNSDVPGIYPAEETANGKCTSR